MMLKRFGFNLVCLVSCVFCDKAIDKRDKNILKSVGGPTLVIIIAFCALIVFIIIILVKRQLLRMLLLSKRGAHTAVASGAPRKLAHEIEASIRRVERMKIEPRMLADNIQQLNNESRLQSTTGRESGHHLYNLRYRFKAVDSMTCFDDLLCSIDSEYCRKSHQTVRDHLSSLQKPPRAPLAGSQDICDKVVQLYEQARFGKKEFGQSEYQQIANYIENLKTRLRQKVVIPGTLVSSDTAASSKDISNSPKRVTHRATRSKPTAVFYASAGRSNETVKV